MSLTREIIEHSGRCVACGLCLPRCPTYGVTRDENESPRGRIALMRALAEGRLEASRRLAGHLSLCLTCRACERVCPSKVEYGRLIDAGRRLVRERGRPGWPARRVRAWLLDIVATPRALARLGRWLRRYQRSGLQAALRATGVLRVLGLARLESLLPGRPAPARRATHGGDPARARVALFHGCIGNMLDTRTLNDSAALLTRFGYQVVEPEDQRCCGALALHAGEAAGAQALVRHNVAAFDGLDAESVVSCASGCGATLKEYGIVVDEPAARRFAAGAADINVFLAAAGWPPALRLRPLPQRVAVHDPCSLRNVLRGERAVYSLLENIPGVRLLPLPGNDRCCGGAGAYVLTHPAMAQRLRDEKLDALEGMDASILVTSNVGCALHLAAGIRARGLDIEVMHPVSLLARQLEGPE